MDFLRRDTTRTCTALGAEGSLRWDAVAGRVDHFDPEAGRWTEVMQVTPERDASYRAQIAALLEAIAEGPGQAANRPHKSNCSEGCRRAGRHAASRGRAPLGCYAGPAHKDGRGRMSRYADRVHLCPWRVQGAARQEHQATGGKTADRLGHRGRDGGARYRARCGLHRRCRHCPRRAGLRCRGALPASRQSRQ